METAVSFPHDRRSSLSAMAYFKEAHSNFRQNKKIRTYVITHRITVRQTQQALDSGEDCVWQSSDHFGRPYPPP